jgi:hypothetical protein
MTPCSLVEIHLLFDLIEKEQAKEINRKKKKEEAELCSGGSFFFRNVCKLPNYTVSLPSK